MRSFAVTWVQSATKMRSRAAGKRLPWAVAHEPGAVWSPFGPRHHPAMGSDAAGKGTLQPEAAMRPVALVGVGELGEDRPQVALVIAIRWSGHSVRIVRTIRSAIELA